MSLTISQQPQELTPAYNAQTIVALSNQIAVPDFYYYVETVVNGDTGNTYTENVLQRPDGYLVFDPIEWVKNYVEHYFNPNINLAYPIELATNKTVSVQVTITEFYSGSFEPSDAVVINYQAFDACLTDKDFRDYDFSDYIFGGTSGKYFLSKDINTITPDSRVVIGQDFWLHFIMNPALPFDNIIITQRHLGSAVDTVSIASIPSATNSYDTYVMQIGTKIFAAPVVGDTVRVDFLNGATSVLRYTYTIQSICTKYSDKILYYLDRDGNMLFFHFEMLSRLNSTKKINTVKLDPKRMISGVYESNSWDRERHVVSTSIENSMLLNMNWINDLQSRQLKDLWASPIIYLQEESELVSISPIAEPAYETKYTVNDKLFNASFNIDLGVTETRQRGI